MKLLKILIIIFIVIFSFPVFSEELKLDMPPYKFNWISFFSGIEEVARVDENCEIHKRRKVGKFIQAELDKYAGICKELKEIEKEIKKEKAGN
jgi:hypothetical protein